MDEKNEFYQTQEETNVVPPATINEEPAVSAQSDPIEETNTEVAEEIPQSTEVSTEAPPENPFDTMPLFGESEIYQGKRPLSPQKRIAKSGIVFLSVICALLILFVTLFSTATCWGKSNTNGGFLSPIFGSLPEPGKEVFASDKNTVRGQYTGEIPSFTVEQIAEGAEILSVKEIAQAVRPSVVAILVSYKNEEGERIEKSVGSGIVMSEDGFILTNAHVVYDGTIPVDDLTIEAVTEGGYTYKGVIMGHDDRSDLAVVKVKAYDLIPAKFADSDQLVVGESIVAIGNPGGLDYAGSVTHGIVSAVNRTPQRASTILPLIQVDAAINPGNSGGALVNEYGMVVGINSAKLVSTSYEGMGFAIPTTDAQKILNDLLQVGYVTGRAWMGISVRAVSADEVEEYSVPEGLIVYGFAEGSPLLTSDVKVGDIIVEVNGHAVPTANDLYEVLEKLAPGDMVKMKIYRPNEEDPTTGKEFEERFLLGEAKN